MKSSTYYFHMKTKILADFQICISIPLSKHQRGKESSLKEKSAISNLRAINFSTIPISNYQHENIIIPFSLTILQSLNPLSAKYYKMVKHTLTQFVGNLPANCLGVFDHFLGLALKELTSSNQEKVLFFLIRILITELTRLILR